MMTLFLETTAPADPNQLMPGLEAEQVSPGVIGFFATFFVVVALAGLIVDFVRRQRRLRYRMAYAAEREMAEDADSTQSGAEAETAPESTTTAAQQAGPTEGKSST